MTTTTNRRDLQGFSHSAQCVAFKQDGTFYVDLHSFDDGTSSGSEYAWTAYVVPAEVPALRIALERHCGRTIWSQDELLQALADTFATSTAVLTWLETTGIPFTKRFDHGAMLDP